MPLCYYIQLSLVQLQIDKYKPPHVENELQAFLKLICPMEIVFRSQMFKENI
jgi:predicted DNA-binding protein (UPF0278 family)